jgi:hypothetical protein
MASPRLPINIDRLFPDSKLDPTITQHRQHHDQLHSAVNLFDISNIAGAGFVPVGDGSVLITRSLLSTDIPSIVMNAQGASYTLVNSDAGKRIEMNVVSANTLYVPAGVFPSGTVVSVAQYGAGATTITGAAILRSRGGLLRLAGQYAEATLIWRSPDEVVVSGDLA